MFGWKRTVPVVLAICALAACASAGGADPFSAPGQTTVRIVVMNLNFQDARLFTYRRDVRQHLGTVAGKTDRQFVLNWDVPEPLYVEIDLLAGPRCFTQQMMVDPGDVLELQIFQDFANTPGCLPR